MASSRHDSRFSWIFAPLVLTGLALVMFGCGGGVAAPTPAVASSGAASTEASSQPNGGRPVAFRAEGSGNPAWVLPPAVPPLPDGVEFRVRYLYPVDDRNELELTVFLTGVGAPTMLPIPVQNIISQLRAKVDRFQVSREPDWNLMITGRVKSTPVPSPFGPQIGRLLSVTAGFTEGTNATFSLLAGTVSGSHSTTLPLATGVIAFGDDD